MKTKSTVSLSTVALPLACALVALAGCQPKAADNPGDGLLDELCVPGGDVGRAVEVMVEHPGGRVLVRPEVCRGVVLKGSGAAVDLL